MPLNVSTELKPDWGLFAGIYLRDVMLARKDVHQFDAGAMGGAGFGTFFRDFFRA